MNKLIIALSFVIAACTSSSSPVDQIDAGADANVLADAGLMLCEVNEDCSSSEKCYPRGFENRKCRSVCTEDRGICRADEVCHDFSNGALCVPVHGEGETCGQEGSECSQGLDCQTREGEDVGHCFRPCNPLVSDDCGLQVECTHYPNLAVDQGFCPIGHLPFGETCPSKDRSECEGGVCVSGMDFVYRCSRICDDDCPSGWYCSDAVYDIPRICVRGERPDFPREGESCARRDCAPGYQCDRPNGCLKVCMTDTGQPCREDQSCEPLSAGSPRGLCRNN